jgi:hypothetical protein
MSNCTLSPVCTEGSSVEARAFPLYSMVNYENYILLWSKNLKVRVSEGVADVT